MKVNRFNDNLFKFLMKSNLDVLKKLINGVVNDLCSKNRFTVTEITAVDTESKNFVDGK